MKIFLLFISFILAYQPVAARAGSVDWAALNPELSDATYVKDDMKCVECHEDYMAVYEKTAHAKTFQYNPKAGMEGMGCENCHGPMSKHLDAPKRRPSLVVSLKKEGGLAPQQKISICLQCHDKGKVAMWSGGVHEDRGLACTDCHSIHSGNPRSLIKPTQVEVCAQCHLQIKAQLQRPSHHPIREGKMQCTDCHNPHGTVTEKLLTANSVNEKCFECHAEKRGPFLWEHAPVTENCLTCHTPHGSSHDKLLISKRPYLCQTCHSNARHPGTLYGLSDTQAQAGQTAYNISNRLFNRACSNCHSQIHGSNHPSGKTLTR